MLKTKRLGQHFLVDKRSLEFISSSLDLRGKTVLEIGAGTGNLTESLAKQAKKVVAIELDAAMVERLRKRFEKRKNVQILQKDALELDFSGYKTIFGNLPYSISSKLLFKILDLDFQQAVLCLQREVAERLVASPNSSEYSRLTVMAQSQCDIELIKEIPRGCFCPIPRVDSAIVHLKKHHKFDLSPPLINALFQHKNQSVKNALMHSSKALGMEEKELKDRISNSEFRDRRVRTLSLAELQAISVEFKRTRFNS